MNNKPNIIFILILLLLLISSILDYDKLNEISYVIIIYLLFRWITNYRKCTISYLECKIRGVKKEQGYLYNILEELFDLNKTDFIYLIYILFGIILIKLNYNYLFIQIY